MNIRKLSAVIFFSPLFFGFSNNSIWAAQDPDALQSGKGLYSDNEQTPPFNYYGYQKEIDYEAFEIVEEMDFEANSLEFMENGRSLACLGSKEVKIWDVQKKELKRTIKRGGIAASGKRSIAYDGWYIYDLKSEKNICKTGFGSSLAVFSRSGSEMAYGSGDYTVLVDTKNGQETGGGSDRPVDLCFLKGGKLARLLAGEACIFDAAKNRDVKKIDNLYEYSSSFSFSYNGKIMAHHDSFFDVVNEKRLQKLDFSFGLSTFSKIDNVFAGANDEGIILWDIKKATELNTLKAKYGRCTALKFSPSGHILAAVLGNRILLYADPDNY